MNEVTDDRPVTIVTGAGSGIGAASARALAASGHFVVCTDIASEGIQRVAAEIGGMATVLDVSDAQACDRVVDEVVARTGRLDGLAHCAGIWIPQRAEETTIDAFDRVLAVNLKGTFMIARAAARVMIAQARPGSIVVIGSVNGVRANPGQFSYAVSKAGVLQMSQALALEWAPHGIRVNIVAPGLTRTGMIEAALSPSNPAAEKVLSGTPLGRVADPSEIAETVEFLISDRASFTTGSYVVADGGWLTD